MFRSQAEENEGERVTKKEREMVECASEKEIQKERESSWEWYMKTEISFILHEE